MSRNKKVLAYILIFTFIFSFLPTLTVKVNAANDDISIISKTNITVETAKKWAKEKGATDTFINLADLYWNYAQSRGGVNAGIAYVQSAKETGFGHFSGVLNESFHNPCGLKTSTGGSDTDPNAHKRFNSWDEGVQAHLDHLALYAGAVGYPRSDTYDARQFPSIKGTAPTVVALGGRWAPSSTYGVEVLSLYNDLSKKQTNSISHSEIDSPTYNSTIASNEMQVSGWALNPSGVKQIEIYVDGQLKSTTKCTISRPDVANAYPGYMTGDVSGYKTVVDMKNVSNGVKTITVKYYGNDGTIESKTTKINLNKPTALQCIDLLNLSGNKLSISGWAINPSGVAGVEVFVDGKSKGKTTYGISRPDVKATYPSYINSDKSGFSANVDVSDIQGGQRTVKVRQTGVDGSVFDSEGTINIDRPEPIGNIDSPGNNSTINGNSLFVGGWVLNNFGVKEVQIYVDGKLKGNADINLARPDVKSVYPQYTNAANSGFSKTVDIKDISGGSKTVEIRQIGNDGTSVSMKTTINVNKPNPIGCIDTPISGAQVNGKTMIVSGWALNSSNIKSVDIFVDGIAKGSATIGQSRPDVKSVYPQYLNAANSGFSKEVNIEDVAGGERILKVVETGNDGTVYTNEAKINVAKLQPVTTVDTPGNGQSVTGSSLTVSGWAINPAGIKQVKVYVDGTYVKDATIGISRTDVKAVYPRYNYAENSGFRTSLNINNIANGSRIIKVEQVGNDGTVSSVETQISINRPAPIGCIDYPGNGQSIDGNNLSLGGWLLNATGIKEVNVYVDDVLLGKATTGISRPDVKAIYPQYKDADKSGYNAQIDIRNIKGGARTLRVEQVGNDGVKSNVSIKININKPTPIECIDTPTSGLGISGKTLKISGWALNPSGVSKVEIYVDGKYKGIAQLGMSRPDVAAAFPLYANGDKSGYSATADINNIAPGNRIVEVRQYGNDGVQHSSLVTINIQKKNPIVTIDSPGNNRVESSDNLFVGGWTLNESGISNVNVYVDDNKVASPKLTMNRPDVIAAFPGYQSSQLCGYGLSIGISNLAIGARHILKVESIGIDGTVSTSTSTFYYKKKNTLIVIDPGHNYGNDGGAVSSFNGVNYSETKLNMDVSLKLNSALQDQGYTVIMTRQLGEIRTDDASTSLRNRAIVANSLNADLFISIHHNSAYPNTTARGSEVYYTERTSGDEGMPPHNPDKFVKSRDLAIATASGISNNTGFINRGGKGDVSSLGIGLSVLRNTKMPAILVECGYISNPTEASLLANASIQQATANGITQAVKQRY